MSWEVGAWVMLGGSTVLIFLGLPVAFAFIAINVSLGLFNLLPIPVLDGGHLVFLVLEGVRGRPVPASWRLRRGPTASTSRCHRRRSARTTPR